MRMPSNWDNIFTLNNMFDFNRQTFQNIQLVTFNFVEHDSSLEPVLLFELLACLIF
jgi:hypothetical protein